MSDFDYLEHYPLEYYGRYVAIELINSLSEQLPVKAALEQRLGIA